MQRIKLDINPKGEIPVLHVGQYDKGRLFEVELVDGEQAYNVPSGYSVQLNVRKTDSKLVTAAPTNVAENILTFATSEQMTACPGENIASVTLKDADDYVITTLYFLISVQRDVLAGGLDSASEIHNLEQQIAAIVPEVIGDDYYNKTETDALLADKANRSELSDLASKAELENAIEEEDRTLKDWAFTQFATPGYIANRYYNKTQVDELLDNIFPTLSASGAIANFKTALNKPLVSVTHDAGATTITRCGVNLFDDAYVDNNLTAEQILHAGTYYIKAFVTGSSEQNRRFSIYFNDTWNVIDSAGTFDDGGITWSGSTFGWLYDNATATVILTKPYKLRASVLVDTYQVRRYAIYDDNSITQFIDYNGQTVPVADATTLTTLSGVNNVYADDGDVTVQYKYMSM